MGDFVALGNAAVADATLRSGIASMKRQIGYDTYSLDEHKIGTWIDGRDLYQRTFEVTGLTKNDWNNDILGTTGIEIKEYTGYVYWLYNSNANAITPINSYRGSIEYCTTYAAADKDDLNILPYMGEAGMSIDKAVITIKYIKTPTQTNLMQTAPTEEVSETPAVEEDDMR